MGPLWQGRFRQRVVDDSSDLLYLSAYVHLNPLVDKLLHNSFDYIWSSLLDYLGLRGGTLCEKEVILYNMTVQDYSDYLNSIKPELTDRKAYRKYIQGLENC